jgi:hypothetical protein
MRLVLITRSQAGELIVPEIEQVQIERISLGDSGIFHPHRKARIQVSVRSLGAGLMAHYRLGARNGQNPDTN